MTFPITTAWRRSLVASAIAASLAFPAGAALAQSSSDNRGPTASSEQKRSDRDARKEWEQTHRASKIIGSEVRNPDDQKVGTVKDLVLGDPASGTISHAVVAVGGVLGMGDKLFAVPFRELRQVPGKNHLVLSTSSDLSQAFDDKNWPDRAAWQDGAPTTRAVGAARTDTTPIVAAPATSRDSTPPVTSSQTSASPSASSQTSHPPVTPSQAITPPASPSQTSPAPMTSETVAPVTSSDTFTTPPASSQTTTSQ